VTIHRHQNKTAKFIMTQEFTIDGHSQSH